MRLEILKAEENNLKIQEKEKNKWVKSLDLHRYHREENRNRLLSPKRSVPSQELLPGSRTVATPWSEDGRPQSSGRESRVLKTESEGLTLRDGFIQSLGNGKDPG